MAKTLTDDFSAIKKFEQDGKERRELQKKLSLSDVSSSKLKAAHSAVSVSHPTLKSDLRVAQTLLLDSILTLLQSSSCNHSVNGSHVASGKTYLTTKLAASGSSLLGHTPILITASTDAHQANMDLLNHHNDQRAHKLTILEVKSAEDFEVEKYRTEVSQIIDNVKLYKQENKTARDNLNNVLSHVEVSLNRGNLTTAEAEFYNKLLHYVGCVRDILADYGQSSKLNLPQEEKGNTLSGFRESMFATIDHSSRELEACIETILDEKGIEHDGYGSVDTELVSNNLRLMGDRATSLEEVKKKESYVKQLRSTTPVEILDAENKLERLNEKEMTNIDDLLTPYEEALTELSLGIKAINGIYSDILDHNTNVNSAMESYLGREDTIRGLYRYSSGVFEQREAKSSLILINRTIQNIAIDLANKITNVKRLFNKLTKGNARVKAMIDQTNNTINLLKSNLAEGETELEELKAQYNHIRSSQERVWNDIDDQESDRRRTQGRTGDARIEQDDILQEYYGAITSINESIKVFRSNIDLCNNFSTAHPGVDISQILPISQYVFQPENRKDYALAVRIPSLGNLDVGLFNKILRTLSNNGKIFAIFDEGHTFDTSILQPLETSGVKSLFCTATPHREYSATKKILSKSANSVLWSSVALDTYWKERQSLRRSVEMIDTRLGLSAKKIAEHSINIRSKEGQAKRMLMEQAAEKTAHSLVAQMLFPSTYINPFSRHFDDRHDALTAILYNNQVGDNKGKGIIFTGSRMERTKDSDAFVLLTRSIAMDLFQRLSSGKIPSNDSFLRRARRHIVRKNNSFFKQLSHVKGQKIHDKQEANLLRYGSICDGKFVDTRNSGEFSKFLTAKMAKEGERSIQRGMCYLAIKSMFNISDENLYELEIKFKGLDNVSMMSLKAASSADNPFSVLGSSEALIHKSITENPLFSSIPAYSDGLGKLKNEVLVHTIKMMKFFLKGVDVRTPNDLPNRTIGNSVPRADSSLSSAEADDVKILYNTLISMKKSFIYCPTIDNANYDAARSLFLLGFSKVLFSEDKLIEAFSDPDCRNGALLVIPQETTAQCIEQSFGRFIRTSDGLSFFNTITPPPFMEYQANKSNTKIIGSIPSDGSTTIECDINSDQKSMMTLSKTLNTTSAARKRACLVWDSHFVRCPNPEVAKGSSSLSPDLMTKVALALDGKRFANLSHAEKVAVASVNRNKCFGAQVLIPQDLPASNKLISVIKPRLTTSTLPSLGAFQTASQFSFVEYDPSAALQKSKDDLKGLLNSSKRDTELEIRSGKGKAVEALTR